MAVSSSRPPPPPPGAGATRVQTSNIARRPRQATETRPLSTAPQPIAAGKRKADDQGAPNKRPQPQPSVDPRGVKRPAETPLARKGKPPQPGPSDNMAGPSAAGGKVEEGSESTAGVA